MSRETELAEMLIGDDARRFLDGDVGRTVLGMAQQEKEGALLELATVDPDDTKRIRYLQNVIWRVDSFASWLAELIERGAQVEKILLHEANEGNA